MKTRNRILAIGLSTALVTGAGGYMLHQEGRINSRFLNPEAETEAVRMGKLACGLQHPIGKSVTDPGQRQKFLELNCEPDQWCAMGRRLKVDIPNKEEVYEGSYKVCVDPKTALITKDAAGKYSVKFTQMQALSNEKSQPSPSTMSTSEVGKPAPVSLPADVFAEALKHDMDGCKDFKDEVKEQTRADLQNIFQTSWDVQVNAGGQTELAKCNDFKQ